MQTPEQGKTKGNPNWRKGGPSPNPTGKRREDAAPPAAAPDPEPAPRMDGWINVLTGLGTPRDKREATTFEVEPVTNEEAMQLWRGDDLAARIIEDMPANMLRRGFELCIADSSGDEGDSDDADVEAPRFDGPVRRFDRYPAFQRWRRDAAEAKSKERAEQIMDKLEQLGLSEKLERALCYMRAYGGSAILLGARDSQADMTKPLNEDRVRSLDFLTVLEPRELLPLYWYADPFSPKYGEPEIYQLNPLPPGASRGGVTPVSRQVHESRLIIFQGIRVSRRQHSVNGGWGDSVLTRCKRVLRNFNLSWEAASLLIEDFSQAIFKMKGLSQLVARDKTKELMMRMQVADTSRSILRAMLIDADGEDFERKSTSVAGLPELLDRFMYRMAAAAEMPVTRLMGMSPAGMNATGESDISMYNERVEAKQTNTLIPAIRRVARLQMIAKGGEPVKWSVKCHPLKSPSEKEAADTRYVQSQTDLNYYNMTALEPVEIRESRFGSDEWSASTHLDRVARAKAQKAMAVDPNGPAGANLRAPHPTSASKPTGGDVPQGGGTAAAY